ncbi:GyrI-like domain-containing protein [Longitalea luteola]|uniref:GyrI-like domain-containing protein n=1 Tax=Longitalea luteola TaxID=2812563 RepID=UPI001A975D82|nr:GyrI-like domain-containing protein [Longitalea luteola]
MKKWIIVPIALIVFVFLAIYIVVPKKINGSHTVTIHCTRGAANRYLVNDNNWPKWWPTNTSLNVFPYKKYTFQPQQRMFDAVGVRIAGNELSINSKIILIPRHSDSVAVQWHYEYTTGSNPVTRVQRYVQARALEQPINEILATAKQFLEQPENVYGIAIKKTTIKDSLLLSTRQVFTSRPATEKIYSLLNKLTTYLQQQGASQTGYPMLNIYEKDSTHFEIMVAVPVNKAVKEQKNMVMKNLVQGYVLVAEIKGGDHTVANAFSQMENYLKDHRYESPAIPFYSLVTNRLTETDTTKWITRINYPVF